MSAVEIDADVRRAIALEFSAAMDSALREMAEHPSRPFEVKVHFSSYQSILQALHGEAV